MFIEKNFNYTKYSSDCKTKYGLTPDYDWAFRTFGGMDQTLDFADHSNIIFSNGALDPWRAGGVTEFVSMFLPLYTIQGGAHHLDMREPTPEDAGSDVEWVRNQEMDLIESWVMDYQENAGSMTKDPEIQMLQN